MLTEIPLHINSIRAVAEINSILKAHKARQLTSRASSTCPPAPHQQGPMNAIQAAGRQAAIEDGVIQHGDNGSGGPTVQSLRRGKWTAEEEEYSARLINEFKMGTLPLTDGTTLRTFLSKLLNCDPMRISKKFVGINSIGKQIFRRNYFDGADQDQVDIQMEQTKRELSELERRFLEKVAETNMKMCTKYEDVQDFGSAEGSPGRMAGDSGGHLASKDMMEQRPWMMPVLGLSRGGDGGPANQSFLAVAHRTHSNSASTDSHSPTHGTHSGSSVITTDKMVMVKRESTAMAPAVTMPFTLAKMHAVAEQNGVLDKNKKRVRQRRRSNSSVSAASDVSLSGAAVKHSPRRAGAEFQIPTYPLYGGSDWAGPRGSFSDQKSIQHSTVTPQNSDSGSMMKRVSSLDLLCSGSMGQADYVEWGFGNMHDWSNLTQSNSKGGIESHRKRLRARTTSFDNEEGSNEGLVYDDGHPIGHSDSTADLMSLLAPPTHNRLSISGNASMTDDGNHDGATPFLTSGLQVFNGNRARTVSGQSYEGSDFGFSYSPRSYPDSDFKDTSRGLQVSGSAVFHHEDSLEPYVSNATEISPMAIPHLTNGVRSENSVSEFLWPAVDFVDETSDSNNKRTLSGDRNCKA